MEDYPRNQLEFETRFASEEACREYLAQLRWPEGFRCPQCGQSKAWPVRDGAWQCAACGRQTSVTAGTLFHRSKLDLRLWFRAMWSVTGHKHGTSALGLQRVLGLGSYLAAWTWLHKLRRAMVRPGRDRPHARVEVDETYVGGAEEGVRGRQTVTKALVAIAVEAPEDGPGIGRIRMRVVADASAASLLGFVREAVEPGTTVHTDGWPSYSPLEGLGYPHEVSVLRDPKLAWQLLPHVHRIASLFKRWWAGTHQGAIRARHPDYYLDEFSFRFNRRNSRSRGKLFYRLVQQAAAIEPTPYQSIVGGKPAKPDS
ncbi:MAG: IS1595 family transposase [Bryobacterales bacterium]|nr:IS1595 family transposase [Bryobacterales bacterium]